jgi:small membrane protein
MIAQFILSLLLVGILLYAWVEYRRSPTVAILAAFVAMAGLYFVWFPAHSTRLAALVGIGRGVDFILYIWVCISLIVLFNVHLKLRTQMELLTILARKVALAASSANDDQTARPKSRKDKGNETAMEEPMSDDKSKRGPQDRSRISLREDYEVRYWSEKFGVSSDRLKAVVKKVGNSADAVEKELKAA